MRHGRDFAPRAPRQGSCRSRIESMTLTFGGKTIGVNVDGENASFTQGYGVYPLGLQVTLTPYGFDNTTVLEFAAELERYGNPGYWLGSATRPVRVGLGAPTACRLAFPLTSSQILGIEENRSGQRPGFNLRLYGYLPTDPGAGLNQESSVHFSIAASTWLDLIERVTPAVAFTIPVPIAVAGGALAEGATLLKEARHQLNAGDFEAAAVTARKVMERAQAAANWPTINRNDDLQTRSQDQRWRAIYKAAFDQASGAIHEDDVTRDFSYSRREAEALIGIAAALLKAAPGPLA
jgi:hypothetical protein